MVIQLAVAFVLASLLNVKNLRMRKLYKTLLMFPWAMPGYVSILLWKTGIFNSEFGLLNQLMEALGQQTVRWLSTDVSAFICCTVVNLWLALPFMIMIMDRRASEHRRELLRERAARRRKLAGAHAVYNCSVHKAHNRPCGNHNGVHYV